MLNKTKIGKIRGKLFLVLVTLISVPIVLFPKHLCIPKGWQCKQYELAQSEMDKIATFIKQFQLQKGYFPETLSILEKYLERTQKGNLKDLKTDPWANLLLYTVENRTHFLLYSVGRNGKNEFGKGDDIIMNTQQNREIYCD